MRYTVQLDIVESAAHLFKEPSSNQVPATRATNWFRTYILLAEKPILHGICNTLHKLPHGHE